MLRQASSRNQRGKIGLKMKNVVQIGLLIAVCIWLFYQMNHSHNKKETFKGTSAKGGGRLFDVRVFGRKEKGDEEAKNGATKEGHGSGSNEELEDGDDDDDDDEAVHKAREISFNDDDASSEVAHTVQEASQPSGERSFKADDAASSAGAHAIQPNEPESESQNESDDKKKKHGEIRYVAEGYQMDELKNFNRTESGVTKKENSSSTADNDTISTRLGTPIPEITTTTSFQNRTTVESKNEGQPFFQANSTYFSKHKIYFQKNSTTVSVELVASPANLTMKLESSNQTPVVHEEMNTTKMQTQREEEKPNSENKLMEQKTLKESSVPLEAGNSLTTQEKKRDVNGGDQSKNSDIQKRADSSSQQEEAVEK